MRTFFSNGIDTLEFESLDDLLLLTGSFDLSANLFASDASGFDLNLGRLSGPHTAGGHDHDEGDLHTPMVVTDYTALLSNSYWNRYSDYTAGTGPYADSRAIGTTFITFSFRETDALPDIATVSYDPDSVFSFSESQRDTTRDFITQYADNVGMVFIEVEEGGMLDFIGVTGSGYGGFAYYPSPTRSSASNIFIEGTVDSANWGNNHVILHEIGHAVGLKHPFEGDITLDPSVDNLNSTVMSYTGVGTSVTTLSPLDLDALHVIYGQNTDTSALTYSWNEATDTLTAIGSSGNDQLSGTIHNNIMSGGAGDDVLLGGGLADFLDGGDGNDFIDAARGADTVLGGAGDDTVLLSGFSDNVVNVDAGIGNDIIMTAYSGDGTIDGGLGYDVFTIGGGGTSLYTSGYTFSSIEEFRGTNEDNYIVLSTQSSFGFVQGQPIAINGLGGTDEVYLNIPGEFSRFNFVNVETLTLYGNQDIDPGALDGFDVLQGYLRIEHMSAGTSDISGNLAAGTGGRFQGFMDGGNIFNASTAEAYWIAYGGNQSDIILLGTGDDYISAGDGDDFVDGGAGADTLIGGAGNDVFVIDHADDRIYENYQQGTDSSYIYTATYTLSSYVEIAVSMLTDSAVALTGNNQDNTLILNSLSSGNTVNGLGGNDVIYVQDNTVVDAGSGNDVTVLGAGNYAIGGTGDDVFILNGESNTVLELEGGGSDTVYSFADNTTLSDNVETLVLVSFDASTINGTGNALNNSLIGTGGANILAGMGGTDYMVGGGGDDLLIGGEGLDIMQGNGGADTFLYNSTAEFGDIIQDWIGADDGFIFAGAPLGFTAGQALVLGSNLIKSTAPIAAIAAATFLWDTDDTALYYDADGTGSDAAVLVADFQIFADVNVDDFVFL